jgi:hypothetical protein
MRDSCTGVRHREDRRICTGVIASFDHAQTGASPLGMVSDPADQI